MVVLLLIPVALGGVLLATWWRGRHPDDLIHQREEAFATLRRMVESPPTPASELTAQTPVLSDHVRILTERPAETPRAPRAPTTRRTSPRKPRRRTSTNKQARIVVTPTSPSVSSPDTTLHLN